MGARPEEIDENDEELLSRFQQRAQANISSKANADSLAQRKINAMKPESINLPRQSNFTTVGGQSTNFTKSIA